MTTPATELIQDITTRFVFTAPEEQLDNVESLMFFVEQAHWYYEDHVRERDPSLRSYPFRAFVELVFTTCPELQHHMAEVDDILERFRTFKKNVPVMGAIMLDRSMERVLLVKGWKSAAGWGFPRGKINKNESPVDCAAREVLEETGYDLEGQLREDDMIELVMSGKQHKLYIVAGVDPDSAKFAPKCKGEIGGYAWHRISDLPITKEEGAQSYVADNGSRHKFFMVWPFMKPLKRWINKRRRHAPDWDMPSPAPQQQQQQRGAQQGGRGRSSGGGAQQAGVNPLTTLFANAASKPRTEAPEVAAMGAGAAAHRGSQHLLAMLQQQQHNNQQQQHSHQQQHGQQQQQQLQQQQQQQQLQQRQQQQQQQQQLPLVALLPSVTKAAAQLAPGQPLSAFRFDVAAILQALELPAR